MTSLKKYELWSLRSACFVSFFVIAAWGAAGETVVIQPRLVHLRNDPTREWSSFPEQAEAAVLEEKFTTTANSGEFALRLRQQDVKQAWRVLLNGKPLGELIRDEADLALYFAVPAGALKNGENELRIESPARGPQNADDIRVGEIRLEPRPVAEAISEATLEIEVVDERTNQPLPARITIATASGARQQTAAKSSDRLAVRPGVIYTADGSAKFGVPAGTYTIYAGRGFEYSLAKTEVTLADGQTLQRKLAIRREVDTSGYVACDTHIHTLTHSGHGDATLTERVITLAGEGIELPIATDHNVHIDYEAEARRLNVRQHFTPVIGNEVTTAVGHFNVFPVEAGARVPDYKLKEWAGIFDEIFGTPGVKVAILNHARDLHSNVRPFGPALFNSAVGENVAGWPMRFNAMEVINSGATQTDPLRLVRDWMALLNRGHKVTPVGSSDSHDVARYIVGQGRTYIRAGDGDVAKLDVEAAVNSFLKGDVLVSYGLLAELTLGGTNGSGQTGDLMHVELIVKGPAWAEATRVQLYANGEMIREEQIVPPMDGKSLPPGVKYVALWSQPRPKHDVQLVAIAMGEGVGGPYWATAKPYQPTSPEWRPYTLGITGPVWFDGDGDGRRTPARGYAERTIAAAAGDPAKLVAELTKYDAAVAAQAASLYRARGGSLTAEALLAALKTAPPAVIEGFRAYREAWRENELNQAKP
jgi:hypothetical protein